jgi:CheY-like chemotaxis protein
MSISELQSSRPPCVLIVDDWPDAAEALRLMLSFEGFKAMAVRDGPSALKAVQAEWPDVVLLDIAMAGMDGYELAKRIRELADHRPCPRMAAVTGNAMPADRQRCLAEGLDKHFAKPCEPSQLVAWIRQVSGQSA